MSLTERFADARPLLLDGAMGTELARRGVAIDGPAWSAAALVSHPDVVQEIHREYVAAGAEVLTANTFRTHGRCLRPAGWERRSKELTRTAVELARLAAADKAWVAGSLAPLEDCYHPELVPSTDELDHEHAVMAEFLAEAGADLILVETHNCVREATAATRAASRMNVPVLVSFVCGPDARLLSGESLTEAAQSVLPFAPAGILVNCLPVMAVASALSELRVVCGDVPIGAYANTGLRGADQRWIPTEYAKPAVYAAAAETWGNLGARIIGGCCGTTPEHISAVRDRTDRKNAAESR